MAEQTAEVKPKKKKKPRPIAWVDWDGCTGCEICIAVCPVDCMYLADSPQTHVPGFAPVVVVKYDDCIGCTICEVECPWDTIEMIMREEVDSREAATDKEILIAYGEVKTRSAG